MSVVMRWLLACITSGLIILPAAGFAQEEKRQNEGPQPDLPGPVHKRLGELAGSWSVSVKYILGDKQQEGKATCEAKLILGDRFLQQEYSSKFQGQPFHVLQILGYDNARKKSIEIMLDTMGTSVLHNEGTVSDDGKVFTNSSEPLDPRTGKPYKLRTVTTIIDHDNFTLEWFRVDDAGKAAKVVSMSHTRKKKDQ